MINLEGKRYCYYIPPDQDRDEHGGYVPAVVVANEPGYYSLAGDLFQMPWVWGKTLAQAETVAKEHNVKLGLSEQEVWEIVASSMFTHMARG